MKRITWINLILGVWLVGSPFLVGSLAGSRIPIANDVILGIVLIAASWWILAARTAQLYVSRFQLLCGAWLIMAPFVLRYRALVPATLNDMIVGALVVIVGVCETRAFVRAPIKAA